MATTDKRGVLATIGLGVLLVLCCAVPALIAAGALGVLGAWLRNPWVIGAALGAALVVAWQVWARHRGRYSTGGGSGLPGNHDDDRPSAP
ncbi:hypothetical protein H7X46_23280 [Pseudonocardia sp. C8]|uniref:Mercuric ion transport protein n=1 Tax=Saccharopolyspora cebuensis TaxID=418759 RepID=A0ABV4CN09_9PSEU|nr:hypothetical protein [Pseudonocardia sp. C8]MBC3193982.1 hypothetical protein [Pseudonocardia sp. C8]